MQDPDKLPSREIFDSRLSKILKAKKAKNLAYMTKIEYSKFIEEVKEAKALRAAKDKPCTVAQRSLAQRRLARFGVVEVNGEEKLIAAMKPGQNQMLFFAPVEELHQVLEEAHIAVGHGGKNRMLPHLKQQYKNVTEEAVLLYLSLCGICLNKKTAKKRGLTVKPMVFREMNDRWQVDLVDWQTSPDGEFKHLLSIMLCFGAPCILQSDNGKEFCNEIITSLKKTWPELKIVHGKLIFLVLNTKFIKLKKLKE
ncbi:KRAB-A domain-containing protein 2-like [Thrips palmi]|uniref:KRAB-A domain-containing protein 2-like n=1 Tax=Thrips palmi TaxID=161013 RepID=A0A6P8ZK07_THRPL|nr:KRAB-A domain-containing protein 2-like [Thrips palmi]